MTFSDHTPIINLISHPYFNILSTNTQRIRTCEFSMQVHGDINQVHSSICVCAHFGILWRKDQRAGPLKLSFSDHLDCWYILEIEATKLDNSSKYQKERGRSVTKDLNIQLGNSMNKWVMEVVRWGCKDGGGAGRSGQLDWLPFSF